METQKEYMIKGGAMAVTLKADNTDGYAPLLSVYYPSGNIDHFVSNTFFTTEDQIRNFIRPVMDKFLKCIEADEPDLAIEVLKTNQFYLDGEVDHEEIDDRSEPLR
jgi:hypothetical protein